MTPIPLPEYPFQYYPPKHACVFQVVHCQVSPPTPYMYLMLYAQPISFFSIWSPEEYLVRSTDHSAPCRLATLRSKYSSQHPVLKHPYLTFLPQRDRKRFSPRRLTYYPILSACFVCLSWISEISSSKQ